MWTYLGIVEEPDASQRIIPDEVSPHVNLETFSEPIRHLFVEIRDPTRGHKLIALIAIVSPSNKRSGFDREAYARKQREVLESDASLIELDLLRGGRRVLADMGLAGMIERLKPNPSYVVLVNRAWRRREGLITCQVFPVGLRDPLPCIAVPLKEGESEVLLDLQDIFDRAYDTGPYRRGAVDYAGPVPAPALSEEDTAWAAVLTRPWREATAGGAGSDA